MKEENFLRMTDLLPLPPAEPAVDWLLTGTLAGIAVLILFWWWRLHRSPPRRLARTLRAGLMTPREAAHRLAGLALLAPEQQQVLDRLRFGRREPQAAEILALLRSVRHGR